MSRLLLLLPLVACTQAPTEPSAEPLRDPPPPSGSPTWAWTDPGDAIGASGMTAIHTRGETLLAATVRGGLGWSMFARAPRGGLVQVFAGDGYGSAGRGRIVSLTRANLHGGPADEILVLRSDGVAEVYSVKPSIQKIDQFPVNVTGASKVVAHDIDGDGLTEMVIVGAGSWGGPAADLVVLDPSGAELARMTAKGGSDVVVGQMDADPSLEIATSSGYVIDQATWQVQWDNAGSFGPMLALGNCDADPQDELIVAQEWSSIEGYNVERHLPAWTMQVFDVGMILTDDLDGDGQVELLVGDDQWGAVHGYRLATRHELWAIQNPEHGVNGLAAADLDRDGVSEVYFAAGASSTGPDYLYQGDWTAEAIAWSTLDVDGPLHGPLLGDLDGGGRQELIVVSNESDSGYDGAMILVFDAASKALTDSAQTMSHLSWSGVGEPALYDVDHDGRDEIIIPGSFTYQGRIEIWGRNAAGALTLEVSAIGNGNLPPFRSAAVADLQQDGDEEIVTGGGSYLQAFDLTGRQVWTSPMAVGDVHTLALGQVDADPGPELVALEHDGDVWLFDATTLALEDRILGQWRDVEIVADPAGGPALLVLVDRAGLVERWQHDGAALRSLGTGTLAGSGDVAGMSQPLPGRLAIGRGSQLTLVDAATLGVLWQSSRAVPGATGGALFAPRTGELITTGSTGVYAFTR
ncbi:MAG TPA: VCBS repeat-containing protein [Myxococcota bacterium]|nr:VCBS repeat-containing protein [Myxococcota bacterium]